MTNLTYDTRAQAYDAATKRARELLYKLGVEPTNGQTNACNDIVFGVGGEKDELLYMAFIPIKSDQGKYTISQDSMLLIRERKASSAPFKIEASFLDFADLLKVRF